MALTRSAKKRVKQNKKRQLVNLARRSEVKTMSKKVLDALDNKDLVQAQEFMLKAEAKLARAKSKRVLNKKTAARKISKLAKKVANAVQSKG